MASVTAKEIPEVQRFFTELWNLYKKHYIPEIADEYWEAVISDFTELHNKYRNLLIAKPMISILMQELEIRAGAENSSTKNKDFKNKKFSSKEQLIILAQLLVDTCTHEEIDIFCISMLDANLKCRSDKYVPSTNGGGLKVKGKRMDVKTRERILELASQGVRQIDISKQCTVSLSTVSKLVCGMKNARKEENHIPQYLWDEWDEVRQSVSKALERNRRNVRTCRIKRRSYRR